MTKYVGTGKWGTRKEVYHTSKTCPYGPENLREVSEEEIEYHDMHICQWCNGEHPNHNEYAGTKLATKLKRLGQANEK